MASTWSHAKSHIIRVPQEALPLEYLDETNDYILQQPYENKNRASELPQGCRMLTTCKVVNYAVLATLPLPRIFGVMPCFASQDMYVNHTPPISKGKREKKLSLKLMGPENNFPQ